MADDITTLLFKLSADVSNFQKDLRSAKSDIKDMADAATKSEGAFDGLVGKFESVGQVASKIGAALAGVGTSAIKAGLDFDEAFDNIQNKTGATGEVLASLQESTKNVFKQMPVDLNQVGEAMTLLYQRTGATGPALEGLATTALNLARVTGEDLSTALNNSTRLFGDWGIKTEEAGKAMDFVFNAARASGAKFNEVSETMVKFGSPLRQMGFDFETTAAMISKFTKEGVEVDKVLAGLRKALIEMGKQGITGDANDALKMFFDQIKSAPTEIQAAAVAAELFGAKAGPDMAAAIREGRFELDEMVKKIKDMPGGIDAAAASTDGFQEKLKTFGNQVKTALEPLGTSILENMDKYVAPAFGTIVSWVEKAVAAFQSLPGPVQTAIGVLAGIGGAFTAIEGAGAALGALGISAGALSVSLAPLGIAVAAVAAAFAGWELGKWAYETFPAFKDAIDKIGEGFQNVWSALQPLVSALGELGTMLAKIAGGVFITFLKQMYDILSPIARFVLDVGAAFAKWALDRIAAQVRMLTEGLQMIVDVLRKIPGTSAILDAVDGALKKMRDSSKDASKEVSGAGESVKKLSDTAAAAARPSGGLGAYHGSLKDIKEAAKEAAEEQAKFEKALSVFGLGMDGQTKKISDMKDAIHVLNQKMNEGLLDPGKYQQAIKLLFDEMAKAEFAAKPLVQALKDIGVQATPAADGLPKINAAIKTLNDGFAAGLVAPAEYVKKLGELEQKAKDLEYPLGLLEPLVKKLNEQLAAGKPSLNDLTAGTRDVAEQITAMGNASAAAALQQAASTVQMVEAEKAAAKLGITLQSQTKKHLDELLDSYVKVASASGTTANDMERAWLAYEKARIEAAVQAGEKITAEDVKTLEKARSMSAQGLKDQAGEWKKFGNQVSTILTDLGKDFADLFFKGGDFVQTFTKAAESIGKAFVRYIFEDSIQAMRKSLAGMNLDMGNIFKGLEKAAEALVNKLKGLFGGLNLGGGGGGGIPTGGNGGGGGGGGIPTGGGGFGFNPGTLFGGLEALFSGLSFLTDRRMEKDIGRIEVTTRGQLNEALNLRDDLWKQHWFMATKLDEMLRDIKLCFGGLINAIRDGQPDHPPKAIEDIKDNTQETADGVKDVEDAVEDTTAATDETTRAVNTSGERTVSATDAVTDAVTTTTAAVQQTAGAVAMSAEQQARFQDAMLALQNQTFGHQLTWAEEQRLAASNDQAYFKYLAELQTISQDITGGPVYSLLDSTAQATADIAGSTAGALPRLENIGSGLGAVSGQIGALAGAISSIAQTAPGSAAPRLAPEPFIPEVFRGALGGSDRGGPGPTPTTPATRAYATPGADRAGPTNTTPLPLNPTTNAQFIQTNSLADLRLAAQRALGPQSIATFPTVNTVGFGGPVSPSTITGGAGPLSTQSTNPVGAQVGGGGNTLNVTVNAATTDGRILAQQIADYVQQSGVMR